MKIVMSNAKYCYQIDQLNLGFTLRMSVIDVKLNIKYIYKPKSNAQ